MTDNTTLNAGTGGDVIASDDIAGVKYQRVKLVKGADGVNGGDISDANPMPVTVTDASLAVTGTFWQATQPVSLASSVAVTDNAGSLTVDAPVATPVFVRLSDGASAISALPITDNGGSVTIDGSVSVSGSVAVTGTFWQATQPVSGTFWQATQPVSLASLPSLAAGTNNIGDVGVLTLPALPAGTNNIGDVDVLTLPATAGVGASTINSTSSDGGTALTNTAQAIKASAGSLCGYYIYNPNAAAVYVQFYNTAQGSVTVGTTNPLFMITIPAASAANLWMQPGCVTFGTAMSWAATSTAGGNGAPTTALDAVCWYS